MNIHTETYPLFSVTGIEIEYMLVDETSLEILPIADKVLHALSPTGEIDEDLVFGNIGISNEFTMHVLEMKSLDPVADLVKLEREIYPIQQHISQLLREQFHAMMLPTGAHPWLIPNDSIALWTHGYQEIYNAYNRIFNCKGHGWLNLQSIHINLPFCNDHEFAQLHNAIRLLMPIIPALTASTPFIEGKLTGNCDSRLTFYGSNQKQFPIISGHIIPEVVHSYQEYQDIILSPMYEAIAPHDHETVLQYDWLNSRGAIARFDRSAIEIRVVDTQESLHQDVACVSAIVAALQLIVQETDQYLREPLAVNLLRDVYEKSIRDGLQGAVLPAEYVRQFGIEEVVTTRQLWEKILLQASSRVPLEYQQAIDNIITHGNLAERMVKYYQSNPSLPRLYQRLADLTKNNGYFSG
ncbi:MAG: glutamate-cysteine ligase family protein [Pseudomonadota bacterium]|nr:glutamate-cysteine ligase family protein [Pseudomonadota bacterium]